jgi:UDP-3-O-[3-hydroxymyristoyl] glucosamine N-acyltransferase
MFNDGAVLGEGVIVNTRAVVEHDCEIGAGTHVAPGAIVLGGCRIGSCAMIGAGAVVLPGAAVADEELVPALTRHGAPA